MIDTIKIYTPISKEIESIIYNTSKYRTSLDKSTGELEYEIITNKIQGSYDTNISIRLQDKVIDKDYLTCLVVEGSYHKFKKGQNSYEGYYNLNEIVLNLINDINLKFNIILPVLEKWYISRIDISKVFDLKENKNVIDYINSYRNIIYPRRKMLPFSDSIYFPGKRSTFKIYNKLKEFQKNDKTKIFKFIEEQKKQQLKYIDNFIEFYEKKIQGYLRIEIEYRKQKIIDINFKDSEIKHIKVCEIDMKKMQIAYNNELTNIIKVNFQKEIIFKKDEVREFLYNNYKSSKATVLYAIYLQCVTEGLNQFKEKCSKSTYYRNIKELMKNNISFSSTEYLLEDIKTYDLSKFKEVS